MKRVNIDKDWLYDQYIVQNKNIEDIAEELGTGRKPIMRSLKEFGIKKNVSDIVEENLQTFRNMVVFLRCKTKKFAKGLNKLT